MKKIILTFFTFFLLSCGVKQEIKLEIKTISGKVEIPEKKSGQIKIIYPQIVNLPKDSPLNKINLRIVELIQSSQKKLLKRLKKILLINVPILTKVGKL